MPTIVTHGVVSLALGSISRVQKNWSFWFLVLLCSIFPDFDVITRRFDIPYNTVWGHRGIFHSWCFAGLLAFFVVAIFYRRIPLLNKEWWSLILIFFITTVSHSLLDAMTNGGLGVAFFAPFNNQRYFLPWRPIPVAPMSLSRFFSDAGYSVLLSEILWLWIPFVLLSIVHRAVRFSLARSASP